MRHAALFCALLTVIVCQPTKASATTAPALTFTELVTRAELIFIGEVMDVRAFPVQSREGFLIKTRVIFRVTEPLTGTNAALEVMEFLGGQVGDLRLSVAEMPTFAIGDRRVVFARREQQSVNPIVGFSQGVFKIWRDVSGVDRVSTVGDVPVGRLESIGRPGSGPVAVAMRVADFRESIRRALAATNR